MEFIGGMVVYWTFEVSIKKKEMGRSKTPVCLSVCTEFDFLFASSGEETISWNEKEVWIKKGTKKKIKLSSKTELILI